MSVQTLPSGVWESHQTSVFFVECRLFTSFLDLVIPSFMEKRFRPSKQPTGGVTGKGFCSFSEPPQGAHNLNLNIFAFPSPSSSKVHTGRGEDWRVDSGGQTQLCLHYEQCQISFLSTVTALHCLRNGSGRNKSLKKIHPPQCF